jgi:hypothetical protein
MNTTSARPGRDHRPSRLVGTQERSALPAAMNGALAPRQHPIKPLHLARNTHLTQGEDFYDPI